MFKINLKYEYVHTQVLSAYCLLLNEFVHKINIYKQFPTTNILAATVLGPLAMKQNDMTCATTQLCMHTYRIILRLNEIYKSLTGAR